MIVMVSVELEVWNSQFRTAITWKSRDGRREAVWSGGHRGELLDGFPVHAGGVVAQIGPRST
jgi:hypothetical protein